ncbi:helix-turn-helix domain-containing protein [Anaerocolumna xylanovorans]|uniref:DNA-binding transcriptional regulator, XRE-family HTH domain n=1 Tax=Anaerocolumna xylanovorans DSM 12503 TaxID=1121345 RepID=A0A1M7YDK7_9FIRM|nr:helix-turn-helix transcriptional regulator [Anaerocolumna xylanovorans]SHO50714.1 DNA-binding transcriptional regulator, XRE-family HTH domain [Anaerocolumna xylanovorans DSM 12503]
MPELLLKDKLKELRTSRHYTQTKVACYLSMTRQGYAHYESGIRTPDYRTLLKLAKLYNVDIEVFINSNTIPIQEDIVYSSDIPQLVSPPGKPKIIQLSPEEKRLFVLFRKLNSLEKKQLLAYLENKVGKKK